MLRAARLGLAMILLSGASASAQIFDRKSEIQDFFDRLQGAVKRRDRTALERMYGQEFLFALGNGGVVTRKQQIDALMILDPNKSTLGETPLEGLRFYGDVAQLRIHTGTSFSVSTFVRRAGHWQIVLTQTNLIPQPVPAPAQGPTGAKKP